MMQPKIYRRRTSKIPESLKVHKGRNGFYVLQNSKALPVGQNSKGEWMVLSPSYYVKLTVDGRQKEYCTHASDSNEALIWVHQFLANPKNNPQCTNRTHSLAELISGYLVDLSTHAGKGHVQAVKTRLNRLANELKWKSPIDLKVPQINSWSKNAVEAGESHRNINTHIHAYRAFGSWANENYESKIKVTGLTTYQEDLDQRRNRRALTPAEFERLLATLRGLGEAGRTRAVVYTFAARTGLRRAEIAALDVNQIHLTESPYVGLKAKQSKNKKANDLPLDSELVDLLKSYLGDRSTGKLFRAVPRIRTFDQDLKRAGIQKRNEQDQTLDFHSLRTSFVTWLLASGANPRAVQELARHSDLKLTTKTYCSAEQLPTRQTLSGLPSFAPKIAPDQEQNAPSNQEKQPVTQIAHESQVVVSKEVASRGERIRTSGLLHPMHNSLMKTRCRFGPQESD